MIILFYDKNINSLNEFYTSPDFKIGHATQMIDTNLSKSNKKLKFSSVFSQEMFKKTEEKFDKISECTNDFGMTPMTIKEDCQDLENVGLLTK